MHRIGAFTHNLNAMDENGNAMEAQPVVTAPLTKKELPEDVIKHILAFSMPHPSLKLLNDATSVIDSRYWKELRQALIIGPFAEEVFNALKNFTDNHVLMETSQRNLHDYEEFIGMPRLPYYGVWEIHRVWVPETDNLPVLTNEEKLQLVHVMNEYIQAQMDKNICYMILKIKICGISAAYEFEDD